MGLYRIDNVVLRRVYVKRGLIMIKLNDNLVSTLDIYHACTECNEPFGTTDDSTVEVEGDYDCVVGKNGNIYHAGCCVEAKQQ